MNKTPLKYGYIFAQNRQICVTYFSDGSFSAEIQYTKNRKININQRPVMTQDIVGITGISPDEAKKFRTYRDEDFDHVVYV